ncbi:MAG: NAD(P)/FAD-dependent oxidoreductase [Candidatus Thermoplasmatota archaeon]|nr:NAD(P)/FAD-dependent oxidoreductase [Candidatus Thermoplasmatota archaeon]
MQVDIIGGGLSGLATALSIKEHDSSVDVIVHEKHKRIGYNRDARKCGEAHSIESFSLKWKPPKDAIATPIYQGKITSGKKTYVFERKPDTAWILDRPAFISSLGKKAEKQGIEFVLNYKITDFTSLPGDIIVDASGCPSVVKKSLGLNQNFGYGFQQTIKNCSAYEDNTLKIIFDQNGGYYWIFPRHPENREMNIGIGLTINNNAKLPVLLEQFKKEHHITGTIDYTIGGLIPEGLQYPLRHKNIIFVGDTGVGTLPMNGQGIYRALLSGDIAGKYVVHRDLKGYAHEIIREFGRMDVIGKLLLRWNSFVYHINPNLVLASWNKYHSLNQKLSFFKSEYDTIH